MNVHYFLEHCVGRPARELDRATETLATIWERTIYLRSPVAD
jgi:hypothetical protein